MLASGSPRRRELLAGLAVGVNAVAVDVDETPADGESSEQLVARLARAKAAAGYALFNRPSPGGDNGPVECHVSAGAGASVPQAGPSPSIQGGGGRVLVVGADTVVDLEGEILGKPVDDSEVETTIARLSGRTHQVFTGVSVVGGTGDGQAATRVVRTDVSFRALTPAEILWYTASGEGRDKAGSYGIQGLGSLLVSRVEGSYPNVVGLPVEVLDEMLTLFGYSLRAFMASAHRVGVA